MTVPREGFAIVLRRAPAVVVHVAEVELRTGMTLVGCMTVPADGFALVFWDVFAVGVHDTEVKLCVGVTL